MGSLAWGELVFVPGHWAMGMVTATMNDGTSYGIGFKFNLFWFPLAPVSCFYNCVSELAKTTVSPKVF